MRFFLAGRSLSHRVSTQRSNHALREMRLENLESRQLLSLTTPGMDTMDVAARGGRLPCVVAPYEVADVSADLQSIQLEIESTQEASYLSEAANAEVSNGPLPLPSGGIQQPTRAFTVSENAKLRTVVGTVKPATRAASGTAYSYELVQGSEFFTMDAVSGKISVASNIDYETTPTIAVSVLTSVNGQAKWLDSLTIQIKNVNEAPDDIGFWVNGDVEQAFQVDEYSMLIGYLAATDPDGDSITKMTLSGDDAKLFEIVSVDGGPSSFAIYSKSPLCADCFRGKNDDDLYHLTLTATDSGRQTSRMEVTIDVLDRAFTSEDVVTLWSDQTGWILRESWADGDQKIQICQGKGVVFSESPDAMPTLEILGNAKRDVLLWDLNGWPDDESDAVLNISFDGRGGDDIVNLLGTPDDDLLVLTQAGLKYATTELTLQVENLNLDGCLGDDVFRFEFSVNEGLPSKTTIVDKWGVDQLDFSAMDGGVKLELGTSKAQNPFHAGQTLAVKSPIEIVVGSDYVDELSGCSFGTLIYGGAGDDRIQAKRGHNILIGGTGADQIFGGSGEDWLIGDDFTFSTESMKDMYLDWACSLEFFTWRVNELEDTLLDSVVPDGDHDRLEGRQGKASWRAPNWYEVSGDDDAVDYRNSEFARYWDKKTVIDE
ncbi:MAG: hypothetical protein PHE53_13555 [Thermoguttaceae bacterium]|nr:hypothetical protein [Thermoguttaceae bacterium]